MTTPFQAYQEGKEARRKHSDEKDWDHRLPYACAPLSSAWIDGWNDEGGHYIWGGKPTPWNEEGGRCPFCYYGRLRECRFTWVLKCYSYTCFEKNYKPVPKGHGGEMC